MKKLLVFVLSLTIFSCSSKKSSESCETDKVIELMYEQQEYWNKGNLDKYVSYYLKSDSIKFVGSRGVTYGYNQILENYKRSYNTPEKRGELKFDILHAECHGSDFINLTGKFSLFRVSDTLSGHFTLHWKKNNGEWKMIYDHTS